jgi:hypothetical protein
MYEYPRIWEEMKEVAIQKESTFERAIIESREIRRIRNRGELDKLEPNALKKIVDEEYKRRETLKKAKKKADPTLKDLMEKLENLQTQIVRLENSSNSRNNSITLNKSGLNIPANLTLSHNIQPSGIASGLEEWEFPGSTMDASYANFRGEVNLKVIDCKKTLTKSSERLPKNILYNKGDLIPDLMSDATPEFLSSTKSDSRKTLPAYKIDTRPSSRVISRIQAAQYSRSIPNSRPPSALNSELNSRPESRVHFRAESRVDSIHNLSIHEMDNLQPDSMLSSRQGEHGLNNSNALFQNKMKPGHTRTYSI